MENSTGLQLVLLTLKKSLFWIILLALDLSLFLHDIFMLHKISTGYMLSLIITSIFLISDLREKYKQVVGAYNHSK